MAGAYRSYREVLAQKVAGTLTADTVSGYRRMAETFAQRKDYAQAINHLRSALNLIGQETATSDGFRDNVQEITWPSFRRFLRRKVARPRAANARESVDLAAGFVVE